MQNTVKKPFPVHEFKIGTTLVIPAQAFDEAGVGIDLTAINVNSQLRTESGGLVADMELQWVDRVNGSYALWLPGSGTTAGFKPGRYLLDVFYTQLGVGFNGRDVLVATDTLALQMIKAETIVNVGMS